MNDQPVWEFTDAASSYISGVPMVSDPGEWSFWMTSGGVGTANSARVHAGFQGTTTYGTSEFSQVGIRVGISNTTGAATIFSSQGTGVSSDPTELARRLAYVPSEPYAERAAFLLFTFSIARGLAIWDNGELVATNVLDKRPLDPGLGNLDVLRYTRGIYGLCGFAATDLSAPKNEFVRRNMEKYVMSLYGLA